MHLSSSTSLPGKAPLYFPIRSDKISLSWFRNHGKVPIVSLPAKVIFRIVQNLPREDAVSWARTCGYFTILLYNHFLREDVNRGLTDMLPWACRRGNQELVDACLDLGLSPSMTIMPTSKDCQHIRRERTKHQLSQHKFHHSQHLPMVSLALIYQNHHVFQRLVDAGADLKPLENDDFVWGATYPFVQDETALRSLFYGGLGPQFERLVDDTYTNTMMQQATSRFLKSMVHERIMVPSKRLLDIALRHGRADVASLILKLQIQELEERCPSQCLGSSCHFGILEMVVRSPASWQSADIRESVRKQIKSLVKEGRGTPEKCAVKLLELITGDPEDEEGLGKWFRLFMDANFGKLVQRQNGFMSVAKHIIATSGYSWSYEENPPFSQLHIPPWAEFQIRMLSTYDNRLGIFDLVSMIHSPSEYSDGPLEYLSEFELFLADSKTWPGLLFEDDWFARQLLVHVMMSRQMKHGTLCRLAGIVEHLVADGASGSMEVLPGLDPRTLLHVACKIDVSPRPYQKPHLDSLFHDMQGCDSAPLYWIQNWEHQRWGSWQQTYYKLRLESLKRIIKALLKGSNVFQPDKSGKTAWRLSNESWIHFEMWVEFAQTKQDLATKRRAEFLQRRVQKTRDLRREPVFREQILHDCEKCVRRSQHFSSWLQKRQKQHRIL
ncbi:hypothetical protein CKAH01_16891 [Colletotrichum kahawae]|uniref:F-box domain-containing protein n=1 Tax=Colletotrichum kahawae TaxID=34407 RepID=A0AAD9YE46_COLKA|nr:hypothetical protein CKAH01_16891 [Colletotrichum kahawae]